MLIFYILQVAIPLALIAWIAIAPQKSIVGFWTQAISTGIGIIALFFTGILLFPPWWVPWVFGVLLVLIVIIASRCRRLLSFKPRGAVAWIITTGFISFALVAANQLRLAYAGAQVPPGPIISLASPLSEGRYLVINGSATTAINAHADALDQSILAHRAYWGTAYGVDFVAIDSYGLRANGIMPSDPRRYRIFGMAVVAPCAGTIIAAVDGLPDMRVPELDERHIAGNYVIIRCDGVDLLLAHFQRGSVSTKAGEPIAVGAYIADVGNSGATSEPHLHIHAQRPGTELAPFSGEPVVLGVEGRFFTRNERFFVRGSR